jgi:hypothetical protein
VISRKVVTSLLSKNVYMSGLASVYRRIGEPYYSNMLERVNVVAGSAVSATGLSSAIGDFVGRFCQNASTGALTVPAVRVFGAFSNASGTMAANADYTASYACPVGAGGVGRQFINGTLRLCEPTPEVTNIDVDCGSAAQVTITMGDNGAALDDIFEVVIDGRTVLTSSDAVRSVSVTLNLPKGRTTVLMRGLAAPDGVGTYFISFAGARVVSGATSGSDLTPGVTKTIVIEVL